MVHVPTDEFSDLMPRGPVMPCPEKPACWLKNTSGGKGDNLALWEQNGLEVGEIAAAAYFGWCGSP